MSGSFAANPALRPFWYAVAQPSELAVGPLGRTVLTEPVVIWRAPDGTLAAAVDRCPHRQARLSEGAVDQRGLQCPYHGWTFDPGGRCTLVPSAGDGGPIPPRAALERVAVTERFGLVWVCLDEPAAPLPTVPEDGDPAFRRINQVVEHWSASTTRMVDNFLDIAHFPYVHRASFGGAADPEVDRIDLEPLGDFFGYCYSVVADNAVGGSASAQVNATVTRHMTTGFALPFTVRSTIEYDTALRHSLLLLSTPRDDESSYFTFVVWRNDDFSVPGDEVTTLDRMIGAEDKRMLERIPGPLPLGPTDLVNVQADRASVEWRRRLDALLRGGVAG